MCEGFDYTGSLNRIQTLMRAMGLRAKAGRKYKVTTDAGHALPIAPNLLGQDFSCDTHPEATSHAKGPDQVWLSDITYLWTREGWLYVCAVLDLFTRKIVGWAMAEHMTRMHSSLDDKSPVQFERDHRAKLLKAANDELIAISRNNSQSARLQKRAA